MEEIKGAFVESLKRNNKQIKSDRAEAIVEDTEVQYRRKLEDITMLIRSKSREREGMLDLSPSTAASLMPVNDFDIAGYVETDVALSTEIRNLNIKLEVVQARYDFLFGKEND